MSDNLIIFLYSLGLWFVFSIVVIPGYTELGDKI